MIVSPTAAVKSALASGDAPGDARVSAVQLVHSHDRDLVSTTMSNYTSRHFTRQSSLER